MSEAPAIGIDLGTTYSCVAVFQRGKVEIICNDQGNKTTPSYVAFTNDQILLGDPAKAQANMNLDCTIFDAKRLIGRKHDDDTVQSDLKNWPFKVVNKNGKPKIKVTVDGKAKLFFPEEILGMVLFKMKQTAEAYLGKTVTKAVITVPAYFNYAQRQSTIDSAMLANLKVLRIINGPNAAALAYSLGKKVSRERKVMIFDLGGGTFDVSILSIADGFCEVISTTGDTHLGGEDFNNRMVDHFAQEFKRKHGKDLFKNKKAIFRLKSACEGAKRTLSSATSANVNLDSICGGIDFYTSITRARFEKLNVDLFQKTLELVKNAIRDAGIGKSQIEDVILVGGSTRIPKVQKLLRDFFDGKDLNQSIDPDKAVAYGAAVQAAILYGDKSKKLNKFVLVDVTPLSLGVGCRRNEEDGTMSVVVERNTTIPTKRYKNFFTSYDYQTCCQFHIYEEEHPKAAFNNLLGSFTFENLPPMRAGHVKLECTFDIDANGILNVTSEENTTGNKNEITLTYNKTRFSREEIQRMIRDAEKYQANVKKHEPLLAARNSLVSFCDELKSIIKDVNLNSIFIADDGKMILKKCNTIIEWVDSDGTAGKKEFTQKRKELKDIFNAIISIPKGDNREEKIYRKVLKVKQNATETEVQEKYRQIVTKFHPDKYAGDKDLGEFAFRLAVNAKDYIIGLLKGKKK